MFINHECIPKWNNLTLWKFSGVLLTKYCHIRGRLLTSKGPCKPRHSRPQNHCTTVQPDSRGHSDIAWTCRNLFRKEMTIKIVTIYLNLFAFKEIKQHSFCFVSLDYLKLRIYKISTIRTGLCFSINMFPSIRMSIIEIVWSWQSYLYNGNTYTWQDGIFILNRASVTWCFNFTGYSQ